MPEIPIVEKPNLVTPTDFEFTRQEKLKFERWKEKHASVCSVEYNSLIYSFRPCCDCGCGMRTLLVKCRICGVRVELTDRTEWG